MYRSNSVTTPSHANIGLRNDKKKVVPQFFKTHNQYDVDMMKVGTVFNRNKKEPFTFTRYKQRATSNYEPIPARSRNRLIDNR